MTCLADFSSLPLSELTAELERMIHNHHAPRVNYASRNFQPPSAGAAVLNPPASADASADGDLS